jgi:hypothetical protein
MALTPLKRPTVKAGADYGEWHYPPELPSGWVVAQRSRDGWDVRFKDGVAPEQRVKVLSGDFAGQSQTLRLAAAIGLNKLRQGAKMNPEPAEEPDYGRAAMKGAARVGILKRLLSAGGKKVAAKTAAKTGAKVAAKGGGKFIPFVGEALMVVDAVPEAVRVQKEKLASVRDTGQRIREAKGVTGAVKELGAGAGRFAVIDAKGALRIGAAALVGSDVVHSVHEASKKPKKNPGSIQQNIAEINRMLKNMPSDWKAQLNNNSQKLRFASPAQQSGTPHSPDAHSVLRALNLNNRGELSSEVKPGQEPTSGNPVPEDVREAAMEGVRLSHQNNYGGYDFIGVARGIQLAISPNISNAALNRIRMYFDRKTKQDRMSDQYVNKHGKRYWSWLNWGGDPAARWSGSKRFAELVKENPMLPVRRNFLFKSDPEAVDVAKRQQLIAAFSAAHPSLPGMQVRTIVRAPAKPGMFSKKLSPALYLVGPVVSERMLTDTSESGSPTTYYEDTSAWILPHVFGAWNVATKHNTKVYAADVYTGQVREFSNINDFEAAVNQARGDWKVLMARSNPYYNPYHKQAIGPQGTVCFYIYNDDGTHVVGPTGPKYCYSLDKAELFVKKAEAAGKRVSPSSVSPGPRVTEPPGPFEHRGQEGDPPGWFRQEAWPPVDKPPRPATPSTKATNLKVLESRMAQLVPILNHHLVKSSEGTWGAVYGTKGRPDSIYGIREVTPRHTYAVLHSKPWKERLRGTSDTEMHYPPEFVVNLNTLELSRSDGNGHPRPEYNFGHIDEVIARGRTLKPRNNPLGSWE